MSPKFALEILRFRNSICIRDQHIANFKSNGRRSVFCMLQRPHRRAFRFQRRHLTSSVSPAEDQQRVVPRIYIPQKASFWLVFRIEERCKEIHRGRREESDKALKKLIAAHQNDAAFEIAEAYAYRGEVRKAFQWLDRSYRQRDPGTPEFKTDPLMKSLRQDPRYLELLKRMRFSI